MRFNFIAYINELRKLNNFVQNNKVPNELDTVILKKATQHNIDPFLLKALVATESSFDPMAYRHEPGFYRRYIQGKQQFVNHKYYDKSEIISASYGAAQIMLTTAWQYGFPRNADYKDLYEPEINLEFGCRVLKDMLRKYGLELGILSYNSGSPRKSKSVIEQPNYVYLKKIAKFYKKFGGQNLIILKHTS